MEPRFGWMRGCGSALLLLAGLMTLLIPMNVRAQGQANLLPEGDSNNPRGAGALLVLGKGKSLQDARKRFEKGAAQGYAPAQVNLAVFYINGWGGVSQNYGKALYWLTEAARQGLSIAYTNLGILYLNGSGVPQDYQEALKDFRYAAEHGETGAMANLGYMTENGMGTVENQVQGAAWYRRAAERGDALGQNNLADCYLRGIGVRQSDEMAASWFQKAADQGQPAARIKLGYLYMTGRGVRKDLVAAYQWIVAASFAGDHRGDEYLPELQARLRPEEVQLATQHARELRNVNRAPTVEIAFVP